MSCTRWAGPFGIQRKTRRWRSVATPRLDLRKHCRHARPDETSGLSIDWSRREFLPTCRIRNITASTAAVFSIFLAEGLVTYRKNAIVKLDPDRHDRVANEQVDSRARLAFRRAG